MNVTLLVALSFALLLAVAALCREVRLRRALQRLLQRIFAYWRPNPHEPHETNDPDPDVDGADRRL
ncbi:MAG: hypothetical protein RIC55_19115 [Pirellulaceae bacterium]